MAFDYFLKACVKADQFLVDRANEVVKAWNWTTGRSRADLANIVNLSGNSILALGWIGFGTFLAALDSFHMNPRYREMDRRERESKESDIMSYAVYCDKEVLKGWTSVDLIASGLFLSLNSATTFDNEAVAGGYFMRAIGSYIMRADYQKPGKSKLVEKVKQGLEKLAEAHEPMPEPSPISNYQEELLK